MNTFCYIHLINGQTIKVKKTANQILMVSKFLVLDSSLIDYVKLQKIKDEKEAKLCLASAYKGQTKLIINTSNILTIEEFME